MICTKLHCNFNDLWICFSGCVHIPFTILSLNRQIIVGTPARCRQTKPSFLWNIWRHGIKWLDWSSDCSLSRRNMFLTLLQLSLLPLISQPWACVSLVFIITIVLLFCFYLVPYVDFHSLLGLYGHFNLWLMDNTNFDFSCLKLNFYRYFF